MIITGGEPFLSDNLIELCKYVNDLNLQLQILTNGTLIDNKVEVLELADKIIISLDAIDPNKNNKIEECKDCLYKYICGGGCRAKAYCVYGQLDAYLKFECKYLKENCEHYLKKR